jgi:hypothetical protein
LAPFVARLASKFEKSSNMTHIFLFTVIKKGLKNAEFHADFKSVEKVFKNAPEKVMSKTSLTNMSKSGKSAYFRHVFAMLSLLYNIMFITLIRKLYLLI